MTQVSHLKSYQQYYKALKTNSHNDKQTKDENF